MSVATDIILPNGKFHTDTNGDLTYRGILDATYKIKNIYAAIEYPYNNYDGSTSGLGSKKTALFLYGATTPQGDATYASAPIGTRFDLHTIVADVVTAFAQYVKVTTGASGWAKVNTSISAQSHIIIAAGTHTCTATTIQTITVSASTVGDLAFVQLCTANGTGAVPVVSNTLTAGFVVVYFDKAGDTSGRLTYRVTRGATA
jgi:hypothetical protein